MSKVIASDSEAIQSQEGRLDCFVAFPPRNDATSEVRDPTPGAADAYTTIDSRFAARVMPV